MTGRRFARVPITALALLTGLMTVVWMGGCPLSPQAQQPADNGDTTTDPNESSLPGQTTNDSNGTNGTDDDRPVTPPPADDGDDASQEQESLTTLIEDLLNGGDGSGGGGDGTARQVSVILQAPLFEVQVPVGETVPVQFTVQDLDGALVAQPDGIRVVLFRDADEDNFPDADIVWSDGNLNFQAGSNTYTLATTAIRDAGLLDATTFGRFILGVRTLDGLGRQVTSFSPRALLVKTEPVVIAVATPVTQTVGIGTPIDINYTIEDDDSALADLTVVVARDDNSDVAPDGDPVFTEPAAQSAVGANVHPFNARQLLDNGLLDANGQGKFIFGLRATDTVGRVSTFWAPGTVTIETVQPGGSIDAPVGLAAVRPGNALTAIFTVTDPDSVLVAQPTGIQFVLANDADANNQADGAPVYTVQDTAFAVGQNVYAVDTNALVSLLDANGNGRFMIGFRTQDQFGRVRHTYSPWALIVDNVAPDIELFKIAIPNENPDFADPNFTDADDAGIAWIDPTSALLSTGGRMGFWFKSTDSSQVNISVWAHDPVTSTRTSMVNQAAAGTAGPLATTDKKVLGTLPAVGEFVLYVEGADAVTTDPDAFYAPEGVVDDQDPTDAGRYHLALTERLVGDFLLERLVSPPDGVTQSEGYILQGFNFNDLAGSSMAQVPDVDGDFRDDFVIVSRFGKPRLIGTADGVGFGEAYMIYGGARRQGVFALNGAGSTTLPGMIFTGIRQPRTTSWNMGISDVSVLPDMDGDELPEFLFSFPRVESINLGDTAPDIQHPELVPDYTDMGTLEYAAYYGASWNANESQFTRGGVVFVSSQNNLLHDRTVTDRKDNRVVDLHEVGQLFQNMTRPTLVPYISVAIDSIIGVDCDSDPLTDDDVIEHWDLYWDVVFDDQGPGGFHMPYTFPTADPPLAQPSLFPYSPVTIVTGWYPDKAACLPTPESCEWVSAWRPWNLYEDPNAPGSGRLVFPGGNEYGELFDESWYVKGPATPPAPAALAPWIGATFWTGFYPPSSQPFADALIVDPNGVPTGASQYSRLGARVLGQALDDEFGTTISTDGRFVFMSAPRHTARKRDVPELASNRSNSGVVYQMRITSQRLKPDASGYFANSQLWLDPTTNYPNPYSEDPTGVDYTMPVPHQYIIETRGSTRGYSAYPITYSTEAGCAPDHSADGGGVASWEAQYEYTNLTGQSGTQVDLTPQVIGPHTDAELRFVRGLGDLDKDGQPDFAVGSDRIKDNVQAGTGAEVGAIFILYGRPLGLEGDYLLERIALDPSDPARLKGILLRGLTDAKLARVFDDAGDFNGDGIEDVVVGSPGSNTDTGEVIVIFGSATRVQSPAGGWTVDQAVAAGVAMRLSGVAAGDMAGANVAGVGDMDGDGISEILIAAPGVDDVATDAGAAYLIYGSEDFVGGLEVSLDDVGKVALPGATFLGRNANDFVGGGVQTVNNIRPSGADNPNGRPTTLDARSRGVAPLGDIDGDGQADFAISSILADPLGTTSAGEVYVIYGRRSEFAP